MDTPRQFKITNSADFDHEANIANQRAKFPGSRYADRRLLSSGLLKEFEAALAAGREEAIQKLCTANPYLLQYVIPNSGHHGIWVFPKPTIRTTAANGTPGLSPDYLVVGASSLGYKWHIIELKLSSVQFANRKGDRYTGIANMGIAQCAKYRAHFAEYVETVRSNIGIREAIVPTSVILLMGDSVLENKHQQEARANFDKLEAKITVASYDRIRQGLQHDLDAKFS